MTLLRPIRAAMVVASCIGIVFPTSTAGAANPSPREKDTFSALPRPLITDVALGENGTVRGQVVDHQGVPVRGSSVAMVRDGQELAHVASDHQGHFFVTGLQGGVYHVTSAQGGGTFRLWAPGTAPPAARQVITVVGGADIVRGQAPRGDHFSSDRFILLSLIAAAIAIPVAIYNNRTDSPSGS